MDPSFLALLAFLIVAVGVAAGVLWPRFRESIQADDPVVPEVLARLQESLAELSEDRDDPVYGELLRVLDHDPREVRRTRAGWRERLVGAKAPEQVLTDLDAL